MKVFGQRLRESRRRAKMTQQQLALVAKVSRDSIGRWEKGVDVPSARMAAVLSQTLDVTLAYLTGLSNRPNRVLLTPMAIELHEIFLTLSPSAQKALLGTARDAAQMDKIGAKSRPIEGQGEAKSRSGGD